MSSVGIWARSPSWSASGLTQSSGSPLPSQQLGEHPYRSMPWRHAPPVANLSNSRYQGAEGPRGTEGFGFTTSPALVLRAPSQEHTHWNVYLQMPAEGSKIACDQVGTTQLLRRNLAGTLEQTSVSRLKWASISVMVSGPAGTITAHGDTFLSCTTPLFWRNPPTCVLQHLQKATGDSSPHFDLNSKCFPTAEQDLD